MNLVTMGSMSSVAKSFNYILYKCKLSVDTFYAPNSHNVCKHRIIISFTNELSLLSAARGCWLHHWLGRGYAADAVSPLPVYWYSFCRPRKDDRLSQPPGVF